MIGRPVEQLLDEVEQSVVGPLHVLEEEDDRVVLGEPFEEQAPAGEQVLALEPRLGGPDQRAERAGAMRRRSSGSAIHSSSPAASFADAASPDASSAIPKRCRTISASAE